MSAWWPLRRGAPQPAQTLEARDVLSVRTVSLESWRLDDSRQRSEPGMSEQCAKAIGPDVAFADVLVPVNARAQRALGVVEVHQADIAPSDRAIEGLDHRVD